MSMRFNKKYGALIFQYQLSITMTDQDKPNAHRNPVNWLIDYIQCHFQGIDRIGHNRKNKQTSITFTCTYIKINRMK